MLHERIKDLLVRDVMILDPIVLHAATPTSGLAETMQRSAQREFPVIDEPRRVCRPRLRRRAPWGRSWNDRR